MAAVKRRPYRTTIRRGDAPALICAAAYRLFSDQGLPGDVDRGHRRRGRRRPTDDLHGRRTQVDHPAPRRRSSPRRRRRTGPDRPATLVAGGHRRARRRALDRTARPQHVPDQPARRAGAARTRDRRVRRRRSREVWDRFQQQRHDGLNEFAVALSRKTDRAALRRSHHHRHPVDARPPTPTYGSSATPAGRSSASRTGSPTSSSASSSTERRPLEASSSTRCAHRREACSSSASRASPPRADHPSPMLDRHPPQRRQRPLRIRRRPGDLYSPPDPLDPAPPGTLIWAEEVGGLQLNPPASVWRMLYHSRSRDDRDIAVSGFAIVPTAAIPGERPCRLRMGARHCRARRPVCAIA